MSAQTDSTLITEPGVYDLPERTYHADPVPAGSLSVSGAKKLLPPSCPAIFRYERENPPPAKDVFDFGTAAHRLVLGVGPDIVGVDADDWRKAEAKAQREEIRSRGCVPMLLRDLATVEEMALAITENPIAKALLSEDGQPEASMFWQDGPTGIWRRGRVDHLRQPRDGRLILVDYKSAASADPDTFARAAATFGYPQQHAWYVDGALALGLAEDVTFVFLVQEKTAPYLTTVVELDYEAVRAGRAKNQRALDIYAECSATDIWPGYASDVALVSIPAWYGRDVA